MDIDTVVEGVDWGNCVCIKHMHTVPHGRTVVCCERLQGGGTGWTLRERNVVVVHAEARYGSQTDCDGADYQLVCSRHHGRHWQTLRIGCGRGLHVVSVL